MKDSKPLRFDTNMFMGAGLLAVWFFWLAPAHAETPRHEPAAPAEHPRADDSSLQGCRALLDKIKSRCEARPIPEHDRAFLVRVAEEARSLLCEAAFTERVDYGVFDALGFEYAQQHPGALPTRVRDSELFREILQSLRLAIVKESLRPAQPALAQSIRDQAKGLSDRSLQELAGYFADALERESPIPVPAGLARSLPYLPLYERTPASPLQNVCGALEKKRPEYPPELRLSALEALIVLQLEKQEPGTSIEASKEVAALLAAQDPTDLHVYSLSGLLIPFLEHRFPRRLFWPPNGYYQKELGKAVKSMADGLASQLMPPEKHLDIAVERPAETPCLVATSSDRGRFTTILPGHCRLSNPIALFLRNAVRDNLFTVEGATAPYDEAAHATALTFTLPVSELDSGKFWEDYRLAIDCDEETRNYNFRLPLNPTPPEKLAARTETRAGPPYERFDEDEVRRGVVYLGERMEQAHTYARGLVRSGFRCVEKKDVAVKDEFLKLVSQRGENAVDYLVSGDNLGGRYETFRKPGLQIVCSVSSTTRGKTFRQEVTLLANDSRAAADGLYAFELNAALNQAERKSPLLLVSLTSTGEDSAEFLAQNQNLPITVIARRGFNSDDVSQSLLNADKDAGWGWLEALTTSSNYATAETASKAVKGKFITPADPDYRAMLQQSLEKLRPNAFPAVSLYGRNWNRDAAQKLLLSTGRFSQNALEINFNLKDFIDDAIAAQGELATPAARERVSGIRSDMKNLALMGERAPWFLSEHGASISRALAVGGVDYTAERASWLRARLTQQAGGPPNLRAILESYPGRSLATVVAQDLGRSAIPLWLAAMEKNDVTRPATELADLGPLPNETRQRVLEHLLSHDVSENSAAAGLAALLGMPEKSLAHRSLVSQLRRASTDVEKSKVLAKLAAVWGVFPTSFSSRQNLFSLPGAEDPSVVVRDLIRSLDDTEGPNFISALGILGELGVDANTVVPKLKAILHTPDKTDKFPSREILGIKAPQAAYKHNETFLDDSVLASLGGYVNRGDGAALDLLEKIAQGKWGEGAPPMAPARARRLSLRASRRLFQVKARRDSAAGLIAAALKEGETIAFDAIPRDLSRQSVAGFSAVLVNPRGVSPEKNPANKKDALDVLEAQGEKALPALPAVLAVLGENGRQEHDAIASSALNVIAAVGPAADKTCAIPVTQILRTTKSESVKLAAAVALLRMRNREGRKMALAVIRDRLVHFKGSNKYELQTAFVRLRGIEESVLRSVLETVFASPVGEIDYSQRGFLVASFGAEAAPAVRTALGSELRRPEGIALTAILNSEELGRTFAPEMLARMLRVPADQAELLASEYLIYAQKKKPPASRPAVPSSAD